MDLSKEMLMDLLLNATGYLAAGGLSLVLYTFFRGHRKARSDSAGAYPAAGDYRRGYVSEDAGKRRRMEFVKLDQQLPRADTEAAGDGHSRSASAMPASSRRNRAQTIGLARKMVAAGASAEKIRAVLPISEAELAFLSSQKN